MKKVSVSSCVRLFNEPVPNETKEPRKLYILVSAPSDDGSSVISRVCIEDKMKDLIPLDYDDVKLHNLVSKGIEPHSLDMIDTNKMGVDAGIDVLANHIINNQSDYVVSSKSE